MKTALLVLWLYSAAGWNIAGVSLGPGWFSTRNHFEVGQEVSCLDLGRQMSEISPAVTKYACWEADGGPPVNEWSKMIR